ncbi:MAG: hypothetical protein JSR76_05110 [Verrucomicrobia bacterium]|nr:hypothetical protein [Verrucomicrobiota bacterium]
MSGIHGSFDKNDPSHVKVSAIEHDKQKDTIFWKHLVIPKEILIKHILYSSLEEKLGRLKKEIATKPLLNKSLREILTHLKTLLEELTKENRSSEYRYAEKLSTNWHLLSRSILALSETNPSSSQLYTLQMFVKKVQDYPKGVSHSLGYYLTEFTGEKWLPFPFMDLLNALHEEHLIKGDSSTLSSWLSSLNFLLTTL